MAGGDVPHRLAALVPHAGDREVGAHFLQGGQEAGAQGIQQHPFHGHLRAGGDQGRDQGEGGRRRVARHADAGPGQGLPPGQGDPPALGQVLDLHPGAEAAQHALGVVAGRLGLDHHGVAPGVQAGQQDRRLDLGRRLGEPVGDRPQVAAPDREGQAAAGTVQEAGAHLDQGLHHPVHRPAAQGGVAGEGGGEVEARGGAEDEAHAGPGVAAVDDVGRLGEAAAPDDAPPAAAQGVHVGAEGAHGRCGAQDVLALQQPLDLGDPGCKGGEDQRPVRDGLVAGGADPAAQGAAPPGAQRGRLARGGHGWIGLRGGVKRGRRA